MKYQINKITSNHVVDFAAEELKKYLRMMMPRCGEIEIKFDPTTTSGFCLGLMSDFCLDTSEAADLYLDDILHIDVDAEGNGVIAGSNPRSVLLAVYRYLTMNGCRWLFPGVDGEFIPTKSIEATEYHKMADCRYRGQCNEGGEYQQQMIEAIDFTPKIGMNIFMQEFDNPKAYYDNYYDHLFNEARDPEPVSEETVLQWKRQCEAEISKRGLQYHDMGHGWTAEPYGINSSLGWKASDEDSIPEEAYQHLAMLNGKRQLFHGVPLNTNVCMSNPETRRLWVKSVADYAELNTNVDYLHIWLADFFNNHCECDECRKKIVTDWYIMLMNEIDEELTARKLATRIVFICYYETIWKSETVNIKNPDRFTMLFAPISRVYHRAVTPYAKEFPYVPFKHNDITLPTDIDEYIPYAKSSMEQYRVNTFLYEYHFCYNQHYNPGSINYARIIYDDVRGYHAHGFHGIIQDGSQRSYWPHGLCFYTYAATLFDVNVKFEDIVEDYFSHAYGADWREVLAFLEKLGEIVPQGWLCGKEYIDKNFHRLYNVEMAPKARELGRFAATFKPFLEAHKNMPYRVQTFSMRLLDFYLDFWTGVAEPIALAAEGKRREAAELFHPFFKKYGEREVYFQTCYDQYNVGQGYAARYFYASYEGGTNIPEV